MLEGWRAISASISNLNRRCCVKKSFCKYIRKSPSRQALSWRCPGKKMITFVHSISLIVAGILSVEGSISVERLKHPLCQQVSCERGVHSSPSNALFCICAGPSHAFLIRMLSLALHTRVRVWASQQHFLQHPGYIWVGRAFCSESHVEFWAKLGHGWNGCESPQPSSWMISGDLSGSSGCCLSLGCRARW